MRHETEQRLSLTALGLFVGLMVGMKASQGNTARGMILGAAACLTTIVLMTGFFRVMSWGIDRLAAADDDLPDSPDYLTRVRDLSLAEARAQAEAILPRRFGLEPAKEHADLMGLPDGVKALFARYSHIRPDHTFAWLDSGLLGWASWDPTLRIIGTDRDGLTIAVRPASETVYEIDWEYDDPKNHRTVAEYPSVYHWILANVWDEPEGEVDESEPG